MYENLIIGKEKINILILCMTKESYAAYFFADGEALFLTGELEKCFYFEYYLKNWMK